MPAFFQLLTGRGAAASEAVGWTSRVGRRERVKGSYMSKRIRIRLRGTRRLQAAAIALATLAAMVVPMTAAGAGTYTLHVTGGGSVHIGTQATLKAELRTLDGTAPAPAVAPVNVDFEIVGVNDTDGDTPTTPDETCTIPIGMSTCARKYPGAVTGTDTVRAWIDEDANDGTVEADPTEGPSATSQPGTIPEPDGTDVITTTWFGLAAGSILSCTPSSQPGLAVGADATVNCTVSNSGTGIAGVQVDGENLDGANDADKPSSADVNADFGCTTDAGGTCSLTIPGGAEMGFANICLWADEDGDNHYHPELTAPWDGALCDGNPDDTSNNTTDFASVSWGFDRKITVAGPASPKVFGSTFSLTGKLSSSHPECKAAGTIVVLRRDVLGGISSFAPVATTPTGADGSYSFQRNADKSADYMVVVQASGSCPRATADRNVFVSKKVTLALSDGRVKPGTTVKFTATVAPCAGHAGDQIKLQKKNADGSYSTLDTKDSNSQCSATFSRKVWRTTTFRAVAPKSDPDHEAGISSAKKVTVRS